ncbi:MAG: antitoxin Xre/MbcA/ParS toxin-binding domain-containing protein, partial [Vulcanimicrobiaceae bacterium]
KRLISVLGLNAAADVLGIDPSQLSRAGASTASISPVLESRIIDVDYVINRALAVMWPDEVGPWLTSPEPLLGGSIPLNVLALSGAARVVQALDARAAGAFA